MTRVLSTPVYQYGGKYRFKLLADLTVDIDLGLSGKHALYDGDRQWAMLDGDRLTIFKEYSFDGCSPSIRVFGRWFGTPTPKAAVVAAAVHDCLRGYLGLPCLDYTREDSDDVFYNLLRDAGFPLEGVYHGAVAGFWGSLYVKLTAARPNKARCVCIPLH